MAKNSMFAQELMKNKTRLFFEFLQYKAKMREVTTIEIKGPTRSGKSTGGIAICFFISKVTGVPFTFWNICANEIEYLQKVKDPDLPDGSTFLIDEQSLSIEEKVRTDKGFVKLDKLNEGDIINVLSYNLKTNKQEYVPATKVRNKEKEAFQIRTKDGKRVVATEDHIFFVKENNKIVEKRLRELKKGDKLICI